MASAMQPNPEELWKASLQKQVRLQRSLQDQLDVRPLLQFHARILHTALLLYFCSEFYCRLWPALWVEIKCFTFLVF